MHVDHLDWPFFEPSHRALATEALAFEPPATPRGDVDAACRALVRALAAAGLLRHRALQIHGSQGVQTGTVVERLYREIRALRICEGASEVQRLIVGRDVLKNVTEPTKSRS
jgi:acyl-CoA dehydrogenase